jgi:hypothetical protein
MMMTFCTRILHYRHLTILKGKYGLIFRKRVRRKGKKGKDAKETQKEEDTSVKLGNDNKRRKNSIELFWPNFNFMKDNTIFMNSKGNRRRSIDDMELSLVFQDSFKPDDKIRVDFEFVHEFYLDKKESAKQRRMSNLDEDIERFLN